MFRLAAAILRLARCASIACGSVGFDAAFWGTGAQRDEGVAWCGIE